jgi:hypothetical protein
MDKRLTWLGIIGPTGFTVAVVVLSALTPGYSHIYNTISELGEVGAPFERVVSLVFIVTGVMLTFFGVLLHQEVKREGFVLSSGVLLIIYAVADFIGSGVFPVDPGGSVSTETGAIHVSLTVIGELSALAMPFLFLMETEDRKGWERMRKISKWIGVASIPATVFLVYTIERNIPGIPTTPIGLAQRIMVGIFLTWILTNAYSQTRKMYSRYPH